MMKQVRLQTQLPSNHEPIVDVAQVWKKLVVDKSRNLKIVRGHQVGNYSEPKSKESKSPPAYRVVSSRGERKKEEWWRPGCCCFFLRVILRCIAYFDMMTAVGWAVVSRFPDEFKCETFRSVLGGDDDDDDYDGTYSTSYGAS